MRHSNIRLVGAGILGGGLLLLAVVLTLSPSAPKHEVLMVKAPQALSQQQMATKVLKADPKMSKAYHRALKDKKVRGVLKAKLTMLCDEGRSHPEYWALKSELDKVDGGEDDSDTLSYDGSFSEDDIGGDMDDMDLRNSMGDFSPDIQDY
mmetsp:Transcript_26072/g.40792  ORF Transcript_26072/g.40792 Transcript_26072/m.40792 type:complete len:150 (-) Transcript_26072:222-671(-)